MSGSSPKPSKPYQGPQFDLQNNVLSNWILGNAYQANPLAFTGGGFPTATPSTIPSYSSPSYSKVYGGPTPVARPGVGGGLGMQSMPNGMGGQIGSITPMGQRINYGGYNTPTPKQQGFTQAGQAINGQMMSNTTIKPTQFQSRTPYQFSKIAPVQVADTYTPQYQMAARDINEQSQRTQEQILSDMNRRGLLTTGAATKAMMLNSQEQDRKLANLASQYSIEQGRAQLQEDQLRRQMDFDRQRSQAEELFRQQGASDEQAKFLAQQALSQQSQQFTQNLQGRQQATAEEQLANLMRRQPLEDLFRLWSQQAQPTGATAGSSGIWGALGPIAGAVAGSFLPGVGNVAGATLGSGISAGIGSMF